VFPDPHISWRGLPSSLDGIDGPHVEIWRSDSYALRCLVSEWRNSECTRVSSVEFDDPLVVVSVEEMIYSRATSQGDCGVHYRPTYVKEATESALLAAAAAADLHDRVLRHFLLVGLSICVEVINSDGPEVKDHPTYDSAKGWALRDAA
jgi:hypothetical protein